MFFKKEKQNRENVVNFDIEKFINMHDYKVTEKDLMPYVKRTAKIGSQ